jgi:hypothetical protein
MNEPPYIEETFIFTTKKYNANYGDDRICECGHSYIKHFDMFDILIPHRCKTCECAEFVEKPIDN